MYYKLKWTYGIHNNIDALPNKAPNDAMAQNFQLANLNTFVFLHLKEANRKKIETAIPNADKMTETLTTEADATFSTNFGNTSCTLPLAKSHLTLLST